MLFQISTNERISSWQQYNSSLIKQKESSNIKMLNTIIFQELIFKAKFQDPSNKSIKKIFRKILYQFSKTFID